MPYVGNNESSLFPSDAFDFFFINIEPLTCIS